MQDHAPTVLIVHHDYAPLPQAEKGLDIKDVEALLREAAAQDGI